MISSKLINPVDFKPLPLQSLVLCKDFVGSLVPLQAFAPTSVTTQFVSEMQAFLNDPLTMMTYRCNPKDFSRDGCFTFPCLAIAIIKEHARSSQDRINHIFAEGGFGDRSTPPTASAFCQDRIKLDPAFFQAWTAKAVQFFYSRFPQEQLVTTWHDRYLWAIDCSDLNIPDTPETRAAFTIRTNQIPGSETVLGQASFAYDVLNEIPVSICLGKIQAEKQFLIDYHAKHLNHDVIVLYDRGYSDYQVIVITLASGADFVIRCPLSQTFKVVEDFINSDAADEIVTIQVPKNKKHLAVESGWPLEVQVRLVKVVLDDGNIEVLMISLLDRDEFPAAEFKWLYGKRWGVETAFLRFKHQLEVECFSSAKIHNIQQDFYAMVFLQVIESIMDKAQDHEFRAKSQKRHLKHEYHVNKAGAYSTLSNHLVGLFLLDQQELANHLAAFQQGLRCNKSVIRPNRHNPRKKSPFRLQMNYQLYRKKRR